MKWAEEIYQLAISFPAPARLHLQVEFKEYAKKLSRDYKKIRDALRSYETDKVVIDEIERATTLLRSLHKNKEYFEFFAPPIASFLPLNQPLYSFICFGVVPALMCTEVHLRPPKFSHTAFRSILQVIDAEEWFHNLHISFEDRNSFVEKTKKNVEGVIFVGSSENVRRVRRKYSNDILFLANGSGHNPVIIGKSANLRLALQRSFEVVLYNQGQDCCAPNTILVDAELCHEFVDKLLAKLLSIEDYVGRSEDDHNIVGHNTSRPHTVKVARMFEELAKFHIYGGDINPITGLIKPTVFLRSLSEGANYTEFFAPIFYIQPYHGMDELRDYFFSKKYRPNAMYVTVFGDCPLIPELLEAGLHDSSNVIYDSNLLIEEEGTKPFGGLGWDASCIYYRGNAKPSAILPQRELHSYLVRDNILGE